MGTQLVDRWRGRTYMSGMPCEAARVRYARLWAGCIAWWRTVADGGGSLGMNFKDYFNTFNDRFMYR
jgi:hypothetical protein